MNSAHSGKIIDTDELKSLMLSILMDVDTYCRKNNIRYFLTYGTLIGAVRHKGFIPWDDDVDICMPRPDYMRFMKEYNHEYYKAYCAEYTPGWDHFIAKVCDDRTIIDEGHGDKCGVYIDVFPLDGWPEGEICKLIHYRRVMFYLRIWSSLHYTKYLKIDKANGVVKNVKILASKALGLICSSTAVLKKLLKVKMKYSFDSSNDVGSLTCSIWHTARKVSNTFLARLFTSRQPYWTMPRQASERLIEGDFEGKMFMIPEYYDEWLTTLYGDYMQLPPEDKRISNHGFKAYWK